ncbi:MAG: OmpA family protein [Chitinophagales bacterium]|nr:OmpA family protein [Chitinophagales bacterium]
MFRYISFLSVLTFLCLYTVSVQAQQDGSYEQTIADNNQLLENEEERPVAYLKLARIYSSEDFSAYNPDTAYTMIREAQRAIRKLKDKKQEKLEKQGLGRSAMRKLRKEIQLKGLAYNLKRGTRHAMTFYIDHYSRLPHELEDSAQIAYLKFHYEELKLDNNYEQLKNFANSRREDLEEYLPEVVPELEAAIFEAYFKDRDSTDINNLLLLLRDYPAVANRVDQALSEAVIQLPLITKIESEIRGIDRRKLPKTIKVIYLYHFYTGEWGDLIGFQNRYPEYAESFDSQRAITLAKMAPDLELGYTDDRYEAYENYIRLAAPVHKAYQALQKMIRRDIEEKRWSAAVKTVEQFAPAFGENDPRITHLLEILQRADENIVPVSLGEIVNSYDGEYAPVISADGQQLYFCRNIDNNEEIYVSEKKNEQWDTPIAIEELNTLENHEAPLALSTDGSTLMMYDNGIVEYTNKGPNGWTKPQHFFIGEREPEWQGVTTFSEDQQVAILAAKTINIIGPRNEDNIDLFVSYKQEDGSWGTPINLGPKLNTPFEDRCPFLHPDQRTLYFSSSGHGGLGQLDVFITRRIGDGWEEWSEPINLGKEINFPGYDWGYRISTDGKLAYFSTSHPYRKEELYQVEVPERFRPQPVSTISGRISGLDGAAINPRLQIEDLTTGEIIKEVIPDPVTGDFIITLPSGILYSYTITGEGLYPISNNLDLRGKETIVKLTEDIEVPTIEQIQEGGLILPIKNLFFDTDKHQIKSASYSSLNRLAELVENYNLQVEIAGHTDNVGTANYNKTLSQNRADAARTYLIDQGVDASQISAVGYGLTQPVATNKTDLGRAQNRRVEIRFKKAGG